MATSGIYSVTVTRDQIVRQALLNIKKIDGIDPIPADIMNDCVLALNLLVKQWQGKADFAPGLKVWTRKRGHLFLRAFTGQYAVGPSLQGWTESYNQTWSTASVAAAGVTLPVSSLSGMTIGDNIAVELDTGDLFWSTIASFGTLTVNLSSPLPSSSASGNVVFSYTSTAQMPVYVETALLRDINASDTPLNIMQSRDYDFLPNKTSPNNYGDPTAIYVETKLGYTNIYTDIAGSNDVTKHIVLTYLEPLQVFVNNTDTAYFPDEWLRPLAWALGKEVAPMFNAAWSPTMEANYSDAMAIAKHKDPEVETRYFQCGAD